METFIQNKVTYLFGNIQQPLPFLLRQEENGHLRSEESVTQILLTKSARMSITRIRHLVFPDD